MTYSTIDDFIRFEILPVLGDFVDDYDLDGIVDEVAEYDGRGFILSPEYHDPAALNEALMRHDRSAVRTSRKKIAARITVKDFLDYVFGDNLVCIENMDMSVLVGSCTRDEMLRELSQYSEEVLYADVEWLEAGVTFGGRGLFTITVDVKY